MPPRSLRFDWRLPFLLIWTLALLTFPACRSQSPGPRSLTHQPVAPDEITAIAARGGTNGVALAQVSRSLSPARQPGFKFLLQNMPDGDLKELPPALLLDNIALAYEALEQAPWRAAIPREIFLNDILPYACVNERRDAWRRTLREKCAPLVKDARTPGEAAQRLNRDLFPLINVRYSTSRKRADQSPLESMESGLATCTGPSILLVDACRSVGVPARLVGTPLWTNLRGNHTWVEIWDGDWHFLGAAEPDPQGLDHGWFQHDAAQARADIPRHAIYASSFQKTGLSFPLVWARAVEWVSAVNVTSRYTPKAQAADPERSRLLVTVLDRPGGRRVAAAVTVTEPQTPALKFEGTSKDESADRNDFLAFALNRNRSYKIEARRDDRTVTKEVRVGTNAEEVIVLPLSAEPAFALPTQACYVTPRASRPLKAVDQVRLRQEVTAFFTASGERQRAWKFPARFEKLLRDNEPAVRQAVWEAFRAAPIHEALQGDFKAQQVRFAEHLSPYTVKTVGTRPPAGWALFIAMHGGGGAPKEVNDRQWKQMQGYYRDHPEAGGYLYVALRAPNDTWNGFYDNYVYPLIDHLTRQFRLFGEIDPNKIFLMGYSHGGYGAYAIGPKMPDHFAAIHSSAAAPTDGETTPKTLRNTIFTSMVGEKDTLYGRYERNQKFAEALDKLRGGRADIYPVRVDIILGNGHTGLPDRDNIRAMYPAVRNPVPHELTWLMTDPVISDFFWLHTDHPAKEREIGASCRENRVEVTAGTNVVSARLLLDSRLVDFDKPVALLVNGRRSIHKLQPSLRVFCETLARRADPELAFAAELQLDDFLAARATGDSR